MSLTKVSYSMILGAPTNVKDFGAKGDGTTDDTAAIQLAVASSSNIWFPSSSGAYILKSPIRYSTAVNIDGDPDVVIKAGAGFTGITVTKAGVPFVLSAMIAVFEGSTINTPTGGRIGEAGNGVTIGAISLDCNSVCDYGIYVERCPGASISASVSFGLYGIYLDYFCWGSKLTHNLILGCTTTGIHIGIGGNGVFIDTPQVWGYLGVTDIGVHSFGNNNGVIISGGYIETVNNGVLIQNDFGSHSIIGIDFELCHEHCIKALGISGETRSDGPINVIGCYLDATDAEIYNSYARFVVSGCRFREPSSTTGSHYYSANYRSIFVLNANSYDGPSGTLIPENLDGTNSVLSLYTDDSITSLTNKKSTINTGAYSVNYGIYNYSSVEQPTLVSSSLEFFNSRQGGATLLYSSRSVWKVNETWTNPTPAIVYTASVVLESIGGIRSLSPEIALSLQLGKVDVPYIDTFTANLTLVDGVAAPGIKAGCATIFVDQVDGDLKILFSDGTTKTIVTDT